ncbi:hypothetical protein EDC04DRAFT_3112644 [Pisolithus marmoratus]|nr:hypothetical protein EDC04DRAFT_3112644 [Pisolithus marmoratus]
MDFFVRKKARPRQSSVSGRDSRTITHTYRKSEASFASGRRSPTSSENGHPASPSNTILRANHISNTEYDRLSRFSSATAQSDGHSTHLSQVFQKQHGDEFEFPRPERDEDIEALFSVVSATRELSNVDHLSIEQKWKMVYAAEQIRWQQERNREEQARKQGEAGGAGPTGDGSPQWYIRKFMDGTITPKEASSVWVSLRGHETSWLETFLLWRGTAVLAQALTQISRKKDNRNATDIALEHEIAKCLKVIFNNNVRVREAVKSPNIVTQIISSLNSPSLSTRRTITEVILSIVHCSEDSLEHVINGFKSLSESQSNGQPAGCYEYWFGSLRTAIQGRGKMGSLVGASDEIRKTGGSDTALTEYALCSVALIVQILHNIKDFDLRIDHRSRMDSSGLHIIITLCRELEFVNINKQLNDLERLLEEDASRLREREDERVLRDFANPEDIWTALRARTCGSRAEDYFLSILRHLLLIREGDSQLVYYYRLLDLLVTDVVMDHKLGSAEQRLGHSVRKLIAQLNEVDRLRMAEDDAVKARSQALHLKLEKETLEEEISQGFDGLVGQLKEKVTHLEQKLNTARDSTVRLQNQLETQKAGYEERIAQLEAQIMELFRMLKEIGKDAEEIIEANSGSMDRKTLIETLNKHFERTKTIGILEGRGKKSKKRGSGCEDGSDDSGKGSQNHSSAIIGRESQFMDADEADVQQQIKHQLVAGANILSSEDGHMASPRTIRGSPMRTNRPIPSEAASLPRSVRSPNLLSPGLDCSFEKNDADSDIHSDRRSLPNESEQLMRTARSGPQPLTFTEQLAQRLHAHGRAPSLPAASATPISTLSTLSEETDRDLSVMVSARKDMPFTPSTKMKQLQWDKLAQPQVEKTLWNDEDAKKEQEMLAKLQADGVWVEMEEDFKAKQLMINLLARQKQAELKSVLDPQTKKRVEILIQRVKKLQPEEIARKIQQFDQDMCTEVFLRELKPVLPTPEQVGKLNVYRNAEPEELAGLHASDRLMVKLIQIKRLGPRIEGMLYKCKFEEQWLLLDDGTQKVAEACDVLMHAKHFKEVLNLILMIGNYMNGTGIKGGAFGFKLVDTKSVNNTTLLHFLERTIQNHFPHMDEFLDELSKPAEAYRVNMQDVRKDLGVLREGLKRIHQELNDHYSDIDQNDGFSRQMWQFVVKANSKLEDLTDDVTHTETSLAEVIRYYGEDEKNISSTEFFAVFKTFVTSFKKCKADNRSAAEEKQATERRKQAMAESRKQRLNDQRSVADEEDEGVLDNLLDKLRNGDSIVRRDRKIRKPDTKPALPVLDTSTISDKAKGMLAQLKADGFDASLPASPNFTAPRRRARRRVPETLSEAGESQTDLTLAIDARANTPDLALDTGSDTTFA